MEPLRRLREAVARKAQELNLTPVEFGVVPGTNGQPDMIMATFKLDPEAFIEQAELEQMKFDQSFEELVQVFEGPTSDEIEEPSDPKDERQAMMNELAQELKRDLEGGDDWI
jgi:hypothetical protein